MVPVSARAMQRFLLDINTQARWAALAASEISGVPPPGGLVCIGDRPMSFERSLARTEELLTAAAERTMRLLRHGSGLRI